MEDDLTMKWGKKFRMLTLSLIFSGSLNIALLATMIFSSLDKRSSLPSFSSQAQLGESRANIQILKEFSELSFRELTSMLTNQDLMEDGFLKRDLALAALCSHHYFNLEKALAGTVLQKRSLPLSQEKQIELYPGLTDQDFQAIIQFAYEEKWPLTSYGLFERLKKGPQEDSLKNAFVLTREFHNLQQLFQKSGVAQPSEILLDLVLEGSWDTLDRFSREEMQMLDFSQEKRQTVLLSYLRQNSPTAAHLLLKTDFSFALKRLTDEGILVLLELLDGGKEEVRKFCSTLLSSPRTDGVWQKANEKLALFSKGKKEEVSSQEEAPVCFQEESFQEKSLSHFHEVQEGESLWKIARQYGMSVQELMEMNDLTKDRLHPGMTLKVAQK